jgi:hypothetical protein
MSIFSVCCCARLLKQPTSPEQLTMINPPPLSERISFLELAIDAIADIINRKEQELDTEGKTEDQLKRIDTKLATLNADKAALNAEKVALINQQTALATQSTQGKSVCARGVCVGTLLRELLKGTQSQAFRRFTSPLPLLWTSLA